MQLLRIEIIQSNNNHPRLWKSNNGMLSWSYTDSFPFIDVLILPVNQHFESFWKFSLSILMCLSIKNDW